VHIIAAAIRVNKSLSIFDDPKASIAARSSISSVHNSFALFVLA